MSDIQVLTVVAGMGNLILFLILLVLFTKPSKVDTLISDSVRERGLAKQERMITHLQLVHMKLQSIDGKLK